MGLFGRNACIKWGKEEYKFAVTMEFVELVDDELNILQMAIDLDSGKMPKATKVARLYSIILNHCGKVITPEEVYEGMTANMKDMKSIIIAAKKVLNLCFPDQIEGPERAEHTEKK